MRYVALMRSVLVNLRYVMVFISVTFVLTIIAGNAYPFETHQLINRSFTSLMICLGV